jgi:hypothetical protein
VVIVNRFEIGLEVSGALRPGAAIALRATARANLETADAIMWIVMPEAEFGREASWRFAGTPTGVPFRPIASLRRAFQESGVASQVATITIPVPGYYRVMAAIKSDAVPPASVHAEIVQDFAYRELWLLIDEDGGRVTESFDTSLLPPGADDSPGPFRQKEPSPAGVGDSMPMLCPCGSVCQPVSCNPPYLPEFTITVRYTNRDTLISALTGADVPLAGAEYHVYTATGAFLKRGITDSYGELRFECAPSARRVYVYLRQDNVVAVAPNLALDYTTATNYCPDQRSTGIVRNVIDSDRARLFANMRETIENSRAFFAVGRAGVTVDYNPTDLSSFYREDDDKIRINQFGVWGDAGIFATAHEYGHALHAKALNGINHSSSGSCPLWGHWIDGVYSMGCAFYEGFANYHGVVTRPDGRFRYSQIEQNVWYRGDDGLASDSLYRDGSQVEGAWAAFLLDMTDPANEPHDVVQYQGSYVATSMRDCRVTSAPGTSLPPSGTDHLVHCFERVIDPVVQANYFTSRDPSERAYAIAANVVTPAGWERSRIRTAWKKNLYGEN